MLPTQSDRPEYFCHRSTGILKYDPGVGTKYHEPWWIVLECDQGIVDYYCWFMHKRGMPVQKNYLWGAHVSVIKGEEPSNKELWGHDFGLIEIWYTNIVRMDNDCHAWLDVWSKDLADVRFKFGLTTNVKTSYHMTLGRLL